MKNILIAFTFICTVGAFAQTKKMTNSTQTAQTQMTSFAPSQPSHAEVIGHIGMLASAIHIGADYNKMTSGSGIGGYFFYQTEKKSNNVAVANQVMSFGGTYKVVVADDRQYSAYVAPGFGIHMAKEAGIPNATTGKQSDETLIGPILKIGALYKVNPGFSIGLERKSITNWFSDSVYFNEAAYYTVAAAFNF